MMATTDIALITDPVYKEISQRFFENPDQFADAFARAWYKLLHRDMGPVVRYLGPWVPDEELLWQDPIPAVDHELIDDADMAALKAKIARRRPVGLPAGLHRMGVGVDLPRHRQARRRQRRAHPPVAAGRVGRQRDLRRVARGGRTRGHPAGRSTVRSRAARRSRSPTSSCSAGGVGVEQAAKAAGHDVQVPFTPGRADATQEQTDVDAFAVLEPTADGFRNYLQKGHDLAAEHLLLDKAFMLTLTAPEMTALVGGLRVLERQRRRVHARCASPTVPETLTNDFFVNLLDIGTEWTATSETEDVFEGRDRGTGAARWTGTRVDLIFGSNSELRALAEVYATSDARTEVRRRLRRRVGQGHGPRPLRPRLTRPPHHHNHLKLERMSR